MNDTEQAADTMEERPTEAKPYLDMIRESERGFQTYQDKCSSIDKIYANLSKMAEAIGDRELQIFWANMEVLKPTIYSRPPQPVVQPRHKDGKEVIRKASEVLERVLEMDIEDDDLHETLKLVRDDLALNARGVPWVLDIGECIHVDRQDFLHDMARKWKECGWVARRAYLTRSQIKKRFPNADATKIKFEEIKADDQDEYKTSAKKAHVWEIWSKTERAVIWVTPDYEQVLDHQDPLFDVKGFFPCPKPACGTLERQTLKPVPDYVYYRDQIDEVNELTARISSLAESLRLKGFYPAGQSELGEAIEAAMKATDNKAILIPVSAAAALGSGGMKDAIVWLPVREVAEVIVQLVSLRRQMIEDIYEITGLSDIMRGSTEAQETATAQNLKAQYGSVRVRERQEEMARVARDVLRLKAEIYAEQVSFAELVEMAGMELTDLVERQTIEGQPEPEEAYMQRVQAFAQQVDALLKNQKIRPFLLDVESDSTIAPNEEAEKASRIEFIEAVGGFIQKAGSMVAAQPETAPFAAEMLKFMAGGFRAGRELGAAIDDFANQIKEKAAQSAGNQQPTPEMMKIQSEIENGQVQTQLAGEKNQAEILKTSAEIEKTRAEIKKIEAETVKIVGDVLTMDDPEIANDYGG
jgi:hypothetical protein